MTPFFGPGTYCSDIYECQSDQCEDEQYCVNSPCSFECDYRREYESSNQMYYNMNEFLLDMKMPLVPKLQVQTHVSVILTMKTFEIPP